MRGVPVRLEIGNRDLDAGVATLVRRDKAVKEEGQKQQVPLDEVVAFIPAVLEQIQHSLFAQAQDVLAGPHDRDARPRRVLAAAARARRDDRRAVVRAPRVRGRGEGSDRRGDAQPARAGARGRRAFRAASRRGTRPISRRAISALAVAAVVGCAVVAGAAVRAPLDDPRVVAAQHRDRDLATARRIAAALLARPLAAQLLRVRCERVGPHVDCGLVVSGVKFHRVARPAGVERRDRRTGRTARTPPRRRSTRSTAGPPSRSRRARARSSAATTRSRRPATVFSITVPRGRAGTVRARLADGCGRLLGPGLPGVPVEGEPADDPHHHASERFARAHREHEPRPLRHDRPVVRRRLLVRTARPPRDLAPARAHGVQGDAPAHRAADRRGDGRGRRRAQRDDRQGDRPASTPTSSTAICRSPSTCSPTCCSTRASTPSDLDARAAGRARRDQDVRRLAGRGRARPLHAHAVARREPGRSDDRLRGHGVRRSRATTCSRGAPARYAPSTVFVTAAGNIDHDAVVRLVGEAFASFARRRACRRRPSGRASRPRST